MNKIILIIIFGLLLPSIGYSQTPEQRYFDWTTLPFTKAELENRRDNLMDALSNNKHKGVLLVPSRDGRSHGDTFRQLDDFYYLTGLELPNSILVMDHVSKSVVIYVPSRDMRFESPSRPNDFPGRPLLDDPAFYEKTGLSFKNIEDFPNLLDQLGKDGKTILVNEGRLGPITTISNEYISSPSPIQILVSALKANHKGLTFKNIYKSMAQVRMIKSEAEIAIMRTAATITLSGIKHAAKYVKAGIDERALEGILEGYFKENGSTRLAFGSIIKAGPNSLWPWRVLATHYNRNNHVLEDGELVIFDVGAAFEQYVSDVGRTFPVSGTFTEFQREILEMETSISDQIIAFIKPGVTFQDIRDLTDRIIPENAKKYMQVGLFFGHHLGLSTGDPNLSDAVLAPGMIFTIEPWYYNHDDNISVFTEDMILVTKDGAEVLTKDLPRTPEALEALMKK